jgi:hypothetical protein
MAVAVDANGDVIASGLHPTVAKVDGATGSKLWHASFDGDSYAPYGFGVAVSGGTTPVLAAARQPSTGGWGFLYAELDPATGDATLFHAPAGQSWNMLLGAIADPPANPIVFGTSRPAWVAMHGTWEREIVVYELDGVQGGGRIRDAAVDASGDVIAVGDATRLAPGGRRVAVDRQHLLVVKLSGADGSTIWQYVIDATSGGYRVALDADGNALVVGAVSATAGGLSPDDMLVVKLADADGAELWRAQIDGGVSSENDVAVDASGDAIVAGRLTLSQSDPLFRGGLAEFAVLNSPAPTAPSSGATPRPTRRSRRTSSRACGAGPRARAAPSPSTRVAIPSWRASRTPRGSSRAPPATSPTSRS